MVFFSYGEDALNGLFFLSSLLNETSSNIYSTSSELSLEVLPAESSPLYSLVF